MESLLLMELFLPLHLQFERSLSCTPAYCSDRPLGLRVCRILIMTSEPIIAPSYGMRTQCQPENVARHGWTIPGRWVHNVCIVAPLGTRERCSFGTITSGP
jgi:hypothetical protein